MCGSFSSWDADLQYYPLSVRQFIGKTKDMLVNFLIEEGRNLFHEIYQCIGDESGVCTQVM